MAQYLLRKADKPIPHSPIFDMESFFWVFLYVLLSRKKSSGQFSKIEDEIWEDAYVWDAEGEADGAVGGDDLEDWEMASEEVCAHGEWWTYSAQRR